MCDFDEDEDYELDAFEAAESVVKMALLSMLEDMDVIEFSRWVTTTDDGDKPKEDDLLACLPFCNEWQEQIVLDLLAALYKNKE